MTLPKLPPVAEIRKVLAALAAGIPAAVAVGLITQSTAATVSAALTVLAAVIGVYVGPANKPKG